MLSSTPGDGARGRSPLAQGTTVYEYKVEGTPVRSTVKITDPAGRWKKQRTDGFGDLVTVTEPNPAGGEYTTSYVYSALGALKTVTMPRNGFKNAVPGQYTQTRTFVYNANGSLYQTMFPETGTTTYTYHSSGQVETQTDALGRKRKWVYENGRLSRIERYYAGVERTAERTVFTYDAYGRTQTVTYGTQQIQGVSETYEYYSSGRLFAKTLTAFGTPLRAEFTYDAEGRAYSTKYPGGTVVYVKYNEADRPKELWQVTPPPAPDALQASAEYDERGWMKSMSRPDWWQQQWTYNEGGLMTGHSVGVPGNPYGGMTSVTYTYGTTAPVSGKLASATQNGNTVNYAYDSLGRLTSATSTAWNQSYTYDGFGNLYQKTGSTGTMNWSALLNSEKNQIGSYDAAGNSSVVGYTWDADNRLIVTGMSKYYVYDSSNQRVIEYHDGADTDTAVVTFRVGGTVLGRYEYSVDPNGTLTTWKEFQYLGGRRTDIGTDRLGSNLNGGRVVLPYGEELSQTPNGEIKFATYWRDADTGLDYADQRYYSPGTGRFLSADPYLASGGTANPSSWNRYAYVEGDPVNRTDPAGLGEYPDFCDYYQEHPACGWGPGKYDPIIQAQDPPEYRLSGINGGSAALDALKRRECWEVVGASSAEDAQKKLNGTKIVGSTDMPQPTYRQQGDELLLSYQVARTSQGVIYLNLHGNAPFINPNSVRFIDADGKQRPRDFSVLELDAQAWGIDPQALALKPDSWAGTYLLHELAHIFGAFPDEQGSQAASAANSRSIYDKCFN